MGAAAVPLNPESVTAEWLEDVLGTPVGDFQIEQIGIGVGLLGRLYRITLSGGRSVVAKFPTLDEGARMNVIEPMNFYEKEVRFYQQAAADTPIGTPHVHLAHFDSDSRDFVILFEDLCGRRMCDQNIGCAVEDAFVAVRALAEHHAYWWESDRFASMPWLPVIADPPFPQVIAGMFKQAWPVAQEAFGAQLGDRYVEFGDRFADLVPWFTEMGSLAPRTYCHGDYRLDNLFFCDDESDQPLMVIDWQLGFRGRGGYDLAYFASQSLTTEDRRANEEALIDLYRQGLAEQGVEYPEDDLRSDYRRTVAFCFCYPVIACGQIELSNDRARALVEGMLDRAKSAIEDVDALALLPG